MVGSLVERRIAARAGGAVVASTLVLTTSFVGVVAFFTGGVAGVGARLPFYVLAMAVTFAGTIFLLDGPAADGTQIIVTTTAVAVASFVFVALSAEGFVYAIRYPERVLASNLLVYFLAAGLICTGLAFWAFRHWREFTGERAAGL